MALTPTTEDLRVPGEPMPGRAAVAEEPEARRERPVFADAAGRRRVWFRTLVQGLCVVAAVWLAALLLGLLGSGSLPGLPRIGGGGDDVQALEATGSDSAAPERAAAGSRSSSEVASAVGASGAALSHQLAAATGGAGLEPSDSGSERRSGYRGDFTTLGVAIEQGHDDAARTNRRSDLRHRSAAPPEHPRGGGRREARGILVGPQRRGGPHARAIEAPPEVKRRQQLKQTVKQRRQQLKQTVKQQRQQLKPVVKQQRQRLKQTAKQQRRQQLKPVVKQQPRQLPSTSSPVRPQPKLKPRPAPPVRAHTAPKPKPKSTPRPAPRPPAAPPTPMAETPGAKGSAKAGARRTVPKATPRRGG